MRHRLIVLVGLGATLRMEALQKVSSGFFWSDTTQSPNLAGFAAEDTSSAWKPMPESLVYSTNSNRTYWVRYKLYPDSIPQAAIIVPGYMVSEAVLYIPGASSSYDSIVIEDRHKAYFDLFSINPNRIFAHKDTSRYVYYRFRPRKYANVSYFNSGAYHIYNLKKSMPTLAPSKSYI